MSPPPCQRPPGLLGRAGGAWVVLAALLLLGALAGSLLGGEREGLLWQALPWQRHTPLEFWRCWSAAFVHFDAQHLAFNAAGVLLIGAIGAGNALPARAALAWALAWSLTHAALWAASAPDRYAGLSGVLHAGAAVAAVFMLVRGRALQRGLGLALSLALIAKLWQEQAWVAPLQQQDAWSFPLAVIAHATGALSGALTAALLLPPSEEGEQPNAA